MCRAWELPKNAEKLFLWKIETREENLRGKKKKKKGEATEKKENSTEVKSKIIISNNK